MGQMTYRNFHMVIMWHFFLCLDLLPLHSEAQSTHFTFAAYTINLKIKRQLPIYFEQLI